MVPYKHSSSNADKQGVQASEITVPVTLYQRAHLLF